MGRILVADDHDALRRGLARGLAEAGHEVEEASNGNAAIERLHDGHYDVVLSDLKMGGSDGMNVLRTARALHPTTAVILMTAFGSVTTAVEAMKYGAFDYVQKVSLGEDTEASYPYKARDGKCVFNKANIAGTCSGHTDVATTETALMAAATGRVISIAIAAEQDFMFYSKGIYDSTTCPTDPDSLNHGVAVVGFDSTAKYWIVRNSWGASWGEQGYVRMAMGKNLCGITDAASYPSA